MTIQDTQQPDAGTGTLDADEMIAAARGQTGLTDFGELRIEEPLRILVDFLNREAFMTPAG